MWIPSTSIAVRASPITPEDKSTSVMIVAWVLMGVLVIMFLSREAVKFIVLRKFGVDDVFILLATIVAVGLSATTLLLSSNGLGVDSALTLRRAYIIMKLYYAFDLLYVAALCLAKLSVLVFFYYIVVQRVQRRVVLGFGIFIMLWTVASLAAVGFQCKLPRPWAMFTLNCFNRGIFWIVYCIIDMTTDVAIIMLSVNLVAYLKVKFSRKLVVVACFAPRVLVIVAAIARLVYLYPITPHDNPAFNLWVPVICALLQVCLSISTACIPYMKPFFEVMEAGVCRADDIRRKGLTVADLYVCGSESGYIKGHKKGKELYSMDSAVTMPLKSGRTPDVSPRIPSPAPLSPLTPPRYETPPLTTPQHTTTNNSRSPSERGLRLNIPTREVRTSSDATSPHTASSNALSPECPSPSPLLTPPRNTPRSTPRSTPTREPTPPLRTHGPPQPYATSSYYGSPDPSMTPETKVLSPPPQRLSLFPMPKPTPRYSLIPQQYPTPAPMIPRPLEKNRTPARVSMHRMQANTSQSHDPQPQRPRRLTPPKFSTAPDPSHPTSTATIPTYQTRTPPTPRAQGISSPPSMPAYYPAPASRPPAISIPTLPSPQRMRNQRILSPVNSHRRDQMSPVSPPTPLTFWRDESSSDGNPNSAGTSAGTVMRINRPWDVEEVPVIQDVRNSPRIVVQRASGSP